MIALIVKKVNKAEFAVGFVVGVHQSPRHFFYILHIFILYRQWYSTFPANAYTDLRKRNYPAVGNTWFISVPRISLFYMTVAHFPYSLC